MLPSPSDKPKSYRKLFITKNLKNCILKNESKNFKK